MSDSGSYSYSRSTSSSEPASVSDAMWAQIARIPIDLLEKTDDFMYIEKVLALISKYDFTVDDPHMRVPENTTKVGRLLRLVAKQCSKKIKALEKAQEDNKKEAQETEGFLKKKIELQNSELAKLRRIESSSSAAVKSLDIAGEQKEDHTADGGTDGRGGALSPQEAEIRQLKAENDVLSAELRKLSRTNDELKDSVAARRREQTQVNGDSDKLYLEYKHLIGRHRRLMEKAKHTEDMLNEIRNGDKAKRHGADSELERLREKVKQLQQENLALIDSRDHAEELCEKREAEALRDMTELRRLTKDLIEEERNKVRQMRDEYASLKDEADAHLEELMQQHDDDLRSKDDEIALLRRQVEKVASKQPRRFHNESDSLDYSYSDEVSASSGKSSSALSAGTTSSTHDTSSNSLAAAEDKQGKSKHRGKKKRDTSAAVPASATAAQRKLERENDDLQAEVEELEVRVDAMEDENRRLTRLVKDYEDGDEGLAHLRHELSDALRTVEVMQDENAQLRERLNGMEDSLAFTAALQELCKRMGVTEEEVNSLKPQNAAAYSEMDTLKEELNVLKEEVEWLEKERRLWMNKVRLQPLLDTKLRFELGLTSDQLRQLDNLVDQMKAGNLIIEDDDKSYKERYFKELEARRKDAAQFNEYVKSRIEEALKSAFGSEIGTGADGDALSALAALKDHIDLITTCAGTNSGSDGTINTPAELTRRQLRDQLESTKRQIGELQLTIKDNTETIAQLREKVAASNAEMEILTKERDQYREAIFAAAGVHASADSPALPQPGAASVALTGEASALEEGSGDSYGEGQGHGPTSPDGAGATVPLSKERLLGFQSKWASISGALRDQLKAKDDLIQLLNERLAQQQDNIDGRKNDTADHERALAAEKRAQNELREQMSALQEINEDLNAKNRELQSINTDLEKGLHEHGLDDGGRTREMLQKVILLRRREAKLLNRLRHAITAEEAAVASEKKMRSTMNHTLDSLREALEGSSSTGFVLPPSSASHNFEEEQLNHLHLSVSRLLNGKLFREDSRYLMHLQQVYHTMENNEEMTALRLREKDNLKEMDRLRAEVDTVTIALTELQQKHAQYPGQPHSDDGADGSSSPYGAAAASKWESESVMWRQKYELCYKRLEAKDGEVALLEKELDTTRQEIVDVKDHVRNILDDESGGARGNNGANSSSSGGIGGGLHQVGAHSTSAATNSDVTGTERLARFEREVARLKSINLGLLQHTLDLQGNAKALEIDLGASKQELALLKDAGNSDIINDFVSAAVREHAALRRQSELALIQARRLKIQLAATEANYQVVANEATAYKLSAYRLYRRYVDEMVGLVDYVRCIQRASKGALSPHRVEIMDRRFQRLAQELDDALRRNKALATDLSDQSSVVSTLEQRLSLDQMARGTPERQDALEGRLREARAAAREAAREITECKEDGKHAEGKVRRLEAYVRQLTDEISRLEFGSLAGVSPLDEELLQNLVHLKDTVFAKAEAPPLAISTTAAATGREGFAAAYRSNYTGGADDPDTAIREYKAAITKQKELAGQCEELRRDLTLKSKETERLGAIIADQRTAMERLEEKTAFYQQQLDDDRSKTDVREARLKRAHETQAEVARRAMEHNAQCLRELVQKKEAEIADLRDKLNSERRRSMEQQLEEASRMERVHESMFRENNAMVERFQAAINSVGDSILAIKPPLPGDDADGAAPSSSVLDQLRYLTSETIRLQRELETARATNIVLENQLSQQINEVQRNYTLPFTPSPLPQQPPPPPQAPTTYPMAPFTPAAMPAVATPPLFSGAPSHDAGAPAAFGAPSTSAVAPATEVSATTGSSRGNVDALTSIIRSQSAMLESLRQREAALSGDLQREKRQHEEAQKALQELRLRHIEKDGALHLVSQVGGSATDPAQVRELRAHLAYVEQELRSAREQLEQERQAARQVQSDASAWKEHLDQLHLQVASQQAEADRARTLASMNEGLQSDLNALKDQNDKLILASSLLKQRLLDEARRGGETSRQHQHEIALAQRMGSLQQESVENVRALDRRIKEVQKELSSRVAKEAEMTAKNEELQRVAFQLHQQLRAKDREVAAATAGGAAGGAPRAPSSPSRRPQQRRDEKGTQVLTSVPAQDQADAHVFAPSPAAPPPPDAMGTAHGSPAPQPVVLTTTSPSAAAAAVNREVHKTQRDNLQQISLLRSTVGRLEKDLADVREQLKGEREAARLLRTQLQAAKKAAEEAEGRHAREVAEAHRRKTAAEGELSRRRRGDGAAPAAVVSSPGTAPSATDAAVPSLSTSAVVADLQRRVAELEPRAARAAHLQQELDELRASVSGPSAPAGGAPVPVSALDMRSHIRTVSELESVVDELRRQVAVTGPARVNELNHHITELQRILLRVLEDLAAAKGVQVDELRRVYVAPPSVLEPGGGGGARTVAQLESELLAKNNALLDLRFTQETLELRVGRLQRHLDALMAADAQHGKVRSQRAHEDRVESLEAVVGNLQVVIQALQKENAELQRRAGLGTQYPEVAREVRLLRKRETELQAQLAELSRQAMGVRSRAGAGGQRPVSADPTRRSARLQERLVVAQATADAYHAELEELRASLEGQLRERDVRRQEEPDRRRVEPLASGEGELPRLDSGAGNRPRPPAAAVGEVPPPLPPAPFAAGAAAPTRADPQGSHASMRHHHIPRK